MDGIGEGAEQSMLKNNSTWKEKALQKLTPWPKRLGWVVLGIWLFCWFGYPQIIFMNNGWQSFTADLKIMLGIPLLALSIYMLINVTYYWLAGESVIDSGYLD